MEFEEKCALIEKARKDYPEFDEEFKEYLGLGYGWNGAYHHFTLEDIKKYEPVVVAEPAKKVEKPIVTTSKSTGT